MKCLELSILTQQSIMVWLLSIFYMVLGGIIFSYIEQKNLDDDCTKYQEYVAEELPGIFLDIVQPTPGQDTPNFEPLINLIIEATDGGFQIEYDQPAEDETEEAPDLRITCPNTWSYWQSILFSATVMTTIGYGSRSPQTVLGQAVYIIYSIFGITIFGGFVTIMSKVMKKAHKWIYKKCCLRFCGCSRFGGLTLGVFWLIGFVFIFVITPAFMFYYIEEDWSFHSAVYFAFTTLTTIGFGDFVPGSLNTDGTTIDGAAIIFYYIVVIIWIFIGLVTMGEALSQVSDAANKLIPTEEQSESSSFDESSFSTDDDSQTDHTKKLPPPAYDVDVQHVVMPPSRINSSRSNINSARKRSALSSRRQSWVEENHLPRLSARGTKVAPKGSAKAKGVRFQDVTLVEVLEKEEK